MVESVAGTAFLPPEHSWARENFPIMITKKDWKSWVLPTVVVVALTGVYLAGSMGSGDVAAPAWIDDFELAKNRAGQEGKLIFMDIYADWCGPCILMDRQTYAKQRVIDRLASGYIPLKVDADTQSDLAWEYGTGALPTTLVLNAEGTPLMVQQGYLSAGELLGLLDDVERPFVRIGELEASMKGNPDSAEILELTEQYLSIREPAEALAVLEEHGKTLDAAPPEEAHPRRLYLRGVAELMGDEYEAGLETLKQFRERFPAHDLYEKAHELRVTGSFYLGLERLEDGAAEEGKRLLEYVVEHTTDASIKEYASDKLAKLE